MPTPPAIDALTITRSKVQLPGDEDEVDLAQEQPMKIETKVEGQPSSSQRVGGRARSRASPSLVFSSSPYHAIQPDCIHQTNYFFQYFLTTPKPPLSLKMGVVSV